MKCEKCGSERAPVYDGNVCSVCYDKAHPRGPETKNPSPQHDLCEICLADVKKYYKSEQYLGWLHCHHPKAKKMVKREAVAHWNTGDNRLVIGKDVIPAHTDYCETYSWEEEK